MEQKIVNKAKKFIIKADSIERSEPEMAYFMRLFAVQIAITVKEKTDFLKNFISEELTKLENLKELIKSIDREEMKAAMKMRSDQLMKKGFKLELEGQITRETAKLFYSASLYLEATKSIDKNLTEEELKTLKLCQFKFINLVKSVKQLESQSENEIKNPSANSENLTDNFPSESQPSSMQQNNFPSETQPSSMQQNNFPSETQPSSMQQNNFPSESQPSSMQQNNFSAESQPSSMQQNNFSAESQPSSMQQKNSEKTENKTQIEKMLRRDRIKKMVNCERTLKNAMQALRFEDLETTVKLLNQIIEDLKPMMDE